MVFSSILFLFRFLPIAMLLYFISPKKVKNFTLLILSVIFYSWGEVRYFPIMIASIVVDYFCSMSIVKFPSKKKLFLLLSVFFNLGMLFFFKYTPFFTTNINVIFGAGIPVPQFVLPLGISFYTFQTMSYTIDVYKGKVEPERNIINFGTFVCLFPQLIAGPIVRYTDINRELKERKIDLDMIQSGVKTFILGLSSKVLLANSIGMLWDEAAIIGFENLSMPQAWLSILGFAFQIYFDFSGYSLMAIGLGKILGFNFPQNFNFPYISSSITEFWRRWHMTLGSWFREYVYIPLGGNRVSQTRHIFNLFVVWFLTGFWHGADWNFIFWGLMFFVLLVVEKFFIGEFLKNHKIIAHVYVVFFLLIGWVLFSISDLSQMGVYFTALFSFKFDNEVLYYLSNYGITILACIIFSTPIIPNYYSKLKGSSAIWLSNIIYTALLLVCVAYLVDSTYNPFLYFRF